MDNRSTPSRYFNTPSPVVFPSASPTPKLFSTPTKKLAEPKTSWQEIGVESVPQNSANIHFDDSNSDFNYHDNYYHQNHYQKHPNYASTTLSAMMLDSDILIDDEEDISSYRFSEEEYLSSIISSSSYVSIRRRPVSFLTPSPSLNQVEKEDGPIIGRPCSPVPNNDPIVERPRRFSLGDRTESDKSGIKFRSIGKIFVSMKKAASGKSFI